jgi:hypothetical protein
MITALHRPCWPSPIVPVLGALYVSWRRAGAPVAPPTGKDPESPAADLLHPAHIEAIGPPGEPPVKGSQSWIGFGQVTFDAVKNPQLAAAAQAHDDMLTSAVSGSLPPQG